MKSNALPSRFRRRPIVIAVVGLVAYVVLVAAFAIPASLMSSPDEDATDEAAELRLAAFEEAHERYEDLQLELAEAQCEADRETVTAGVLVDRLERALERTDAISADTSLISFAEKTPLLEAVESAREDLAGLNVTAEQQALVDEHDGEAPDCDSATVEPEPFESDDPPTAEQVEELEELVAGLEAEIGTVAPEGVSVEEITAIIDPLGDPAVAAAETRTLPAYYQNFLASGSAETMESFVEASGDLDGATASFGENASAEETLLVFERLAELADWSNQVIDEHNGASQEPAPTTQPPAPPTDDPPPDDEEEEDNEESPEPTTPEDPFPSEDP